MPHKIWTSYLVQQDTLIAIGHLGNNSNQTKSKDRKGMHLLHGMHEFIGDLPLL